MKEEEEDWLVYHLIPEGTPTTVGALVDRSCLDAPVVEASLARLERLCLIERAGSTVRILAFGESLIRNQMKYTDDLPFTIENGVIKERKR